ncbi:MAG: sugar phosphate isomerase/epimerase [Actinomycetota bacterium]|nr:sugar phosphate isomerase/epimerase [Actinomycetota bacterium]
MSERAWKLAGAPISWGVCEVPGWGPMLPPDRVLGEMATLGLTATELGPDGYLPADPAELRALLGKHGLSLVAAFVPAVLHEDDRTAGLEHVRRQAAVLTELEAEQMLFAPVVDLGWTLPSGLDQRGWENLAAGLGEAGEIARAAGIGCCVHPHLGSLVETAEDIRNLTALTEVEWCFDTAHLMIGGVDQLEFAREHADLIRHVHLKDVDGDMAAKLARRELTHLEAASDEAFLPLGQGDAPVAAVIETLTEAGYDGWMVLEQDTSLSGPDVPEGDGPVNDVRLSLEFIRALDDAAAVRA